MTFRILAVSLAGAALMAGCSQAENMADKAADTAASTVAGAADKVAEVMPGADIKGIAAGTYKIDPTHGYVMFSYSHNGFSVPLVRWRTVNATVELNTDNPESSSVEVSIPTASVDSGVDIWDEHLREPDWFDAEGHPMITFTSTQLNQALMGKGTMTGDLTIKGKTTPITFDVTLNKVGQHFRKKVDMFGISAEANIKRAEYGIDKYASVGGDVKITIEAEFQKAE